jgi:hypothetical protein
MPTTNNTLYNQVVEVTRLYLGPAAERFISRQIQTHIGKEPQELVKDDLATLVDWTKLSIALLTDDEEMVEEFASSISNLAKEPAKG